MYLKLGRGFRIIVICSFLLAPFALRVGDVWLSVMNGLQTMASAKPSSEGYSAMPSCHA